MTNRTKCGPLTTEFMGGLIQTIEAPSWTEMCDRGHHPPKQSPHFNLVLNKYQFKQLSLERRQPASKPTNPPVSYVKTTHHNKRVAFSLDDRILILDENLRGASMTSLATKYNTTRLSISNWKKGRASIEESIEESNRGKRKTIFKADGLVRVKTGVKQFHSLNKNMPKDLKIPITGKCTVFNCVDIIISNSIF